MPALLFVLVVRLMVDGYNVMRKLRASRRRSRCIDCAYAHVQYATNGLLRFRARSRARFVRSCST
jgi:hypothetical protein